MKMIQLLSIVFSLTLFTGITAGSTAFAEPDRSMHTEQLNEFCEMSTTEQEAFLEAYALLAQYRDQLAVYCQLDTAEERLAYLEEQIAEHKKRNNALGNVDDYCAMSDTEKEAHVIKHNVPPYTIEHINKYCSLDVFERDVYMKKFQQDASDSVVRYEMAKALKKYCEMSAEEQAAYIEKHNKTQEKQNRMNSYCSMNDDGKKAYIEEHKDKFKNYLEKKMYLHSMKSDMNAYCEMSTEEQAAAVEKLGKSENKIAKMNEYCTMDEDARAVYIKENIDKHMNNSKKYLEDTTNRHHMETKLNSYCKLTAEEQAALIEKHGKSEDKVAKMNEYCSLDEEGRQAFIEEHKDEYKKHHQDKKMHKDDYYKHKKHMSNEHKDHMKGSYADFNALKSEFHALKTKLATDDSLNAEEKQELRMQFMEKAKAAQLAWIKPQN